MKSTLDIRAQEWRSAITDFADGQIRVRGMEIGHLMSTSRFADVVFLLFAGRQPRKVEARLLDAILVAATDHGPTSPSALTGRVIASGNRRAPEAAVAGGLLAIGDAHGGAGEAAMVMLEDARRLTTRLGGVAQAADALVAQAVKDGGRLPGLGHRFHSEDPRTTALWSLASESKVAADAMDMMRAIADALARKRGRSFPVNVDGAIAAILVGLGFEPIVGRLVFLIGRCAGIAAHVREELDRERPLRIRFPYVYDGPVSSTEKVENSQADDAPSSR